MGGLMAPDFLFGSFYRCLDHGVMLPAVRKSDKKFKDLVMGLAAGAECLDDWDKLANDLGMQSILNSHIYTPKAYGDYLRAFSSENILEANRQLIAAAYGMRASLFPERKRMVVDFDSTSNQQFGTQMEGVEYSGHKKMLCLDTIQAFEIASAPDGLRL